MHVVLGQLDIAWEDPEANIRRVGDALRSLRPRHGSWVILPEMWATGFSMDASRTCGEAARLATEAQRGWAMEFSGRVLGGIASQVEGKPMNRIVGHDASGREWLAFAKLHGFSPANEPAIYAPGSGVVVCDADDCRVAPFLCYDLRFPEVFREASALGADLMVVAANWPARRDRHWRALLVARAIENQAWVVGVNRAGADPHATYAGRSLVVDPTGVVRADLGEGERWLGLDIDITEAARWRAEFPAWKDRRPAGVRLTGGT